MPRFVVLTHDHPFLHWDLMLEHEGHLRTWRLMRPPDAGGSIKAESLGDHRLAYLDYEGPVSHGRGTVKRWDAGTYETLEATANRLVIHFAGEKLVGVAPLWRLTAEGCLTNLPIEALAKFGSHWTFWRLPPRGPDRVIEIPQLLTELIAEGRWPSNRAEARRQNRVPLVSEERVKALVPNEKLIHLTAPPFLTVREAALQNPYWCDPQSDPSGIDFDLAIEIGDFGIGSDAPILLDYRQNIENPRVIRLQWPGNGSSNKWVPMAEDFQSFVDALGL